MFLLNAAISTSPRGPFLNHFRPERAHDLRKGHTVWLSGDGTREQCEQMHEVVQRTSPNYYNIADPIELTNELFVE